ncbi:DUF1465 family protein [Sandarakinorhabdus sp.]|uniref:DUF1465 family protein n=1 Tax=Sandarakinorhabdus sp. TaxID=1916663 RepID=UPI00286E260C|nr:DUF1465 family protein [Sandarakinorhabdus sp.]
MSQEAETDPQREAPDPQREAPDPRREAPDPKRNALDPKRDALDRLYRETVDCGDMARGWFDGPGLTWRQILPIDHQAMVASESLATTARLMSVMSWLLDPAHARVDAGADAGLKPFRLATEESLDASHPLSRQPGGTIAAKSRELVARAAAMSALYQEY